MSQELTDIELDEVSVVDAGANQKADIMLAKKDDGIAAAVKKALAEFFGAAERDAEALEKAYTDAEKAYMDKLTPDARKEFMALTPEERQKRMKVKKEDTMTEKHDAQADLAKRYDEELQKRDAEIAILKDAMELAKLEKRAADELSGVTGTVEQKARLLKALDTLADADREYAMSVIKAAKAAAEFTREIGTDSGVSKQGSKKFEELVKSYAETHKVSKAVAYTAVSNTEEGRAAYLESMEG